MIELVDGVVAVALDDVVLAPPQREVDLEDGLEGLPVGVVFDHGGGQGVLEGLPVLEGDVAQGLHGIEVLGQAHRDAGGAQLLDESRQRLQQAGRAAGRQADGGPVSTIGRARPRTLQVLGRLVDVGLVLEQDVERLGGRLGVDRLDPEQQQGAGPVERLRHRRRLFQLQIPDGAHDADHLVGQGLGDAGHPGQHDLLLPLEVGIVDVQEQAAPLEGLGQLPGVVGGQEDQRDLGGAHRPELGDRHLVVGEDLEQQGLGLHLDPVHLVDQQHDRLFGPDGLQQRPGQEERLGEDVLLDVLPVVAAAASPTRWAWMRRSCFL